jgi:hypothetical protein
MMYCTVVALAILTQPGGVVVGTVPAHKEVVIEQASFLRDFVFVSKPGPDGNSPRGWISFSGLGPCGGLPLAH